MGSPDERADLIRVAVVADSTSAAGEIARGLRDSRCAVRAFSLSLDSAYDRVRDLQPAVVLLRTSTRSFALASAFARVAANGGPALVLLTPGGSHQATKMALDSGAFVHLVEPVPAQALTAAVQLAAARARDVRDLRRHLSRARESLRDRKVLDRAKAILMRRFGVSEEDAHRRLQRESRNRNRRLIETAWHVVHAEARLAAQSGGVRSKSSRPA